MSITIVEPPAADVRRAGAGMRMLEQPVLGIRACPNPKCRGVVFLIVGSNSVLSFPAELIDFTAEDIPPAIVNSLEEAIKCHSTGCYKASALMVRRVLEELCRDRQASGNNLKERIAALTKIMVIPIELLEAADHLRLLGNDAAHIEATTYNDVGRAEVEAGITLDKRASKIRIPIKGPRQTADGFEEVEAMLRISITAAAFEAIGAPCRSDRPDSSAIPTLRALGRSGQAGGPSECPLAG